MNIYKTLEQAIISDNILEKERLATLCLEYCSQNEVMSKEKFTPVIFSQPSYASFCTIVKPKNLPTRKDFETNEGLATLVHSIAHIEFSAIDLALDAVYRFPHMKKEYKVDWLEVAVDEIRHFNMLDKLLKNLGFKYGDFPVHSGLFDVANNTAHNLLDRIAIVPRYFEASGLDVSPQIIKKLKNKYKFSNVQRLIDILYIIQEEEIVHVYKGDKWFKYLCNKDGKNTDVFFEILKNYNLLDKYRPYINTQARKKAGFSCIEIKRLGAMECS